MNLLAVDWDFFFPTPWRIKKEDWTPEMREALWLYDWGHREDMTLFFEWIWPQRAAGFVRNGLELPGIDPTWETFWDRFTFSKGTELWYANSNMHAVRPGEVHDIKNVVLYDAHHDAGYREGAATTVIEEGRVTCEDWMLAYWMKGCGLQVRYPAWATDSFSADREPEVEVTRVMDDGQPLAMVFDAIFLCQSQAWTPPWHVPSYQQFLVSCPVFTSHKLDGYPTAREFSMEQVQEIVEQEGRLLAGPIDGTMDTE